MNKGVDKILLVAGARPNFMKIAPILRALNKIDQTNEKNQIDYLVVHTGQHYDYEMLQAFFDDLEMRSRFEKPDFSFRSNFMLMQIDFLSSADGPLAL